MRLLDHPGKRSCRDEPSSAFSSSLGQAADGFREALCYFHIRSTLFWYRSIRRNEKPLPLADCVLPVVCPGTSLGARISRIREPGSRRWQTFCTTSQHRPLRLRFRRRNAWRRAIIAGNVRILTGATEIPRPEYVEGHLKTFNEMAAAIWVMRRPGSGRNPRRETPSRSAFHSRISETDRSKRHPCASKW